MKESFTTRLVAATATIVIVANEFNPAIFTAHWLSQYNVLKTEDIIEGAVFTSALANIPTKNFLLTIIPNRIQMVVPRQNGDDLQKLTSEVLGNILKEFPHIPMIAIGINFDYFATPENYEFFAKWNEKNFASQIANEVVKDTGSNPRFGSYFSLDIEEMRLKIDIKPVYSAQVHTSLSRLKETLDDIAEWNQVNFNFHKDLANDTGYKDIYHILAKFGKLTILADKTAQRMVEN